MTEEVQNYEPIQGLPAGVAAGINPVENFGESVDILIDQGDVNPLENFSESPTVFLGGEAAPIESYSESVVVTVT